LEILIVVAIILIIATIAIPSLMKNRVKPTVQVVKEKHEMTVDFKLVSEARWTCAVSSDDYLKAEVDKPFKCQWRK